MSEKIVLIDGHSILNRAFYGIPMLTNAEGTPTNAVYGFLNIMMKILDEEKPQYLAVAFDLHAPTFRHKMYDAYKGTRKGMPEELRKQVPLIQEVLKAMQVPLITMEGYEADDLLGTVGRLGEEKGMEVTIVSGDRDLLQLATDHVLVRIPKTKGGKTVIEDYHAEDVKARYQVTPPQIIELKALMGDTADNIPGIPGVGEKTATKIIAEYGTIENAYAHVDEIKPNKAQNSLREHYDLAQLSKQLATINVNSPVEFDWEASRLENLYTAKAYEWCKKLEFKNMLPRFEQAQKKETPGFEIITQAAQAGMIWMQASHAKEAGVAILTEEKKVIGAGLAFGEERLYYFPVSDAMDEKTLRNHIQNLFTGDCAVGAPDVKLLRKYVEIEEKEEAEENTERDRGAEENENAGTGEHAAGKIFDLGIASYLLNPLKNVYTFDDAANEFLQEQLPSREEIFAGVKKINYGKAPVEQTAAYAAYQAYVCQKAQAPMRAALKEQGMLALFDEIEMPLLFTLDDMEKEGILVKAEELKIYGEKLQVRILELEQSIYEKAGEKFNINSPKQLGVILFEKMQMPGGKKTKTGYSTAADVLDKLAPEYPFVADILEYRQLTKLKSTYADGLAAYIEADGRIHSTFNQTITATGRISSTEPNLQNIPIRMELGRMIRKVFVPKPGFVFLDADYSQIELRVLAHMSGDEMLIEAYRQAQDIHRITASQVFGIPFDEVTPLQRRNAKAVNFGIVYGISSFGLSQDLSITRKEAQDYIEQYFATYPGIKKYLDGEVQKAKDLGYVETMFGRRRPVPEISSSNFMQRSFGERIAMNSPIQGTAADIIKIAMVRVNRALRHAGLRSRLILQVHDELLIETAEEELEQVSRILADEMHNAAKLRVELEIDMHTGTDWYEAK